MVALLLSLVRIHWTLNYMMKTYTLHAFPHFILTINLWDNYYYCPYSAVEEKCLNRAMMITRSQRSKWRSSGLVVPESQKQCKPKNNYLYSRPAPKGSVSEWTLSQYHDQSIKTMFKYSRLSGKWVNPLSVASAGKTKSTGGRRKDSHWCLCN